MERDSPSPEGLCYREPEAFDTEPDEDFVGQDFSSHVGRELRTIDDREVKITGWLSDRGLFTVISTDEFDPTPEYTLSPRRFGMDIQSAYEQAA